MAIHTDAISQIYARSLYELADKAGGLEKIFEIGSELEQICELARADRSFAEFLASPIIEKQRRADALGRILRDRITDLTLRFILVVNEKGRLGHLETINGAYDQLVQAAHGRVEVDVFTATTLDETQLATITTRIKAALGRDPVLHTYQDESMIGGVKLRIGDELIDGSVATQIRRLKHRLATTGAAEIRARADRIIDVPPGEDEAA